MRIDELSRNELRESQAATQEVTSQIQELQERLNYMNDSGEFQDVGSAMQFCGYDPSAGKKEFMVDGFLANLGVGVLSLFCSSLPATGFPALSPTEFPPEALGFRE